MTSPAVANFLEHSERIARSFLQTVVVIDDRAYEPTEYSAKPTAPLESPVRPEFAGPREAIDKKQDATSGSKEPSDMNQEEGLEIEQAKTAEETSEDIAHQLDAKRVIEQFANSGIVCAVLRPSEFEVDQFDSKVYAISERADVVVLDWVWFKDTEGKKVSELIAQITKKASEQHRLRLILVYTGEKRLTTVIDDIAKVLERSGVKERSRKDAFTIESGGTRITVYGKGNVDPKDDILRTRMSPFDELPNTVVAEFAKMTAGLLSNVALDSLAGLRSNTHRILARFNPELDAAYLTHRALSEPPEEAELHLVPLILSEIQAVLEDRNVSDQAGPKSVEEWLNFQIENGMKLDKRMGMTSGSAASKAMLDIIEKGVRDKKLASSYPEMKEILDKLRLEDDKNALNQFTNLLTKEGTSGDAHDEELALLMSIRSRYGAPPPVLTLGTIIANDVESGNSEYWLCVQPVCDSVRLKKEREFPFLRMTKSQKNDSFGYLVRENDGMVKLNLSLRPFESRLIPFSPNTGEKDIRASASGDKWFFNASGSDPKAYRWIADLKTEHAQRVANDYAVQISRVGLAESEWLRRWAKKK